MNNPSRSLLAAGAVLAGLAVVTGAFGAHALKPHLTPEQLASYHTGVDYQFYHALALLMLGLWPESWRGSLHRWAGIGMIVGTILFSFSIYGLTVGPLATGSPWKFMGPITPLGGSLLIISWVLVLLAVTKISRQPAK